MVTESLNLPASYNASINTMTSIKQVNYTYAGIHRYTYADQARGKEYMKSAFLDDNKECVAIFFIKPKNRP